MKIKYVVSGVKGGNAIFVAMRKKALDNDALKGRIALVATQQTIASSLLNL